MKYDFLSLWLKFFFLLTPFFALSVFTGMTGGWAVRNKLGLALRVTVAAFAAAMFLLFLGNQVFAALGITVDAFRIGGGALLFLSAVKLVNGVPADSHAAEIDEDEIAVVPLAVPITVGPGTAAALLVMGTEAAAIEEKLQNCAALFAAVCCSGLILLCASHLERVLGKRGITILSKLTGLVLAALSAQMIFTGIRAILAG